MFRIEDSVKAFEKVRHLKIHSKCVPVASRSMFLIGELKILFPELQTIDIDMASSLNYPLENDNCLYAHAFEALRLLRHTKGHDDDFNYYSWPSPTTEQIATAQHENLIHIPANDGNSIDEPHCILAKSLRMNIEIPPLVTIDPSLTAWYARLIDDSCYESVNPKYSVEVRLHTTLKLRARNTLGGRSPMFLVRNVRSNTSDFVLSFELAGTEVTIAQLFGQTWFDSRFGTTDWTPMAKRRNSI